MVSKKRFMRFMSLFAAIALIAGYMPHITIGASALSAGPLQFNADGKFTVMQITDIQDDSSVDDRVVAVITKAIARYHPDLVVFTGDNVIESVLSASNFRSSVDDFLAPLISSNTKFAVTFGNHDDEGIGAPDKDEQYAYYKSAGGSNFVDFDVANLDGGGNGVIPIYPNGQSSGTPAYQVYLMDSGTNASSGSNDCCYTNQIDYYCQRSLLYPDVPSIWFQHIPIPDMYTECMTQVSFGTANSQLGNSSPFSGKSWILTPERINWAKCSSSVISESYCESVGVPNVSLYQSAAHRSSSSYGSKTLYEAWNSYGNMKGAYFGHDHKNEFTVTTDDGIDLGYGESTGLYKTGGIIPYNDGNPGVSVYELDIDGSYTDEFSAETDLAQKYVSFKSNGGSGTMRGQMTKNSGVILNSNTFTRCGYIFEGWSTSAGGSAQYTDSGYVSLSSSNLTLYAVWRVDQLDLEAGAGSTTVIDKANSFIYGLVPGMTQEAFENGFVHIIGNGKLVYSNPGSGFGTGTKIELVNNATDEIIQTYQIVIFGDVNGDGAINGIDAGTIVNVENYTLAWDSVTDTALIRAGDINGDGSINGIDAGIMVNVENYLVNINQATGLQV